MLVAAEKGLRRLWDAYEILKKLDAGDAGLRPDKELDEKINTLIDEFDSFMNDDFNTAKVLANMFEIVPVINSIKDGLIDRSSLGAGTIARMQETFTVYLENILGLKALSENNEVFNGVMQLLDDIRKEAKSRKDFSTSDKIRKQLASLGIEMKDEKDGSISWNLP